MFTEKTNTFTILTPEGIRFSLQLAGPVTRFLAWSVDLAVITAATGIISVLLGLLRIISSDLAGALTAVAFFIVSIGYGIASEWLWKGQTLGKRLLNLRVMDIQGLHLHFSQIMIRNLLRFVDGLPVFYFVGGLACLLTVKAQRLGDIAANTIVIRTPKISDPDLTQLLAGKYNSFLEHPNICARLRQKTTPKEAGIALQALLRREELEPQTRIELYERIASHFKTLAEFPEETTYGITGEQYLRNVVEIVYSSKKEEYQNSRDRTFDA